MSSSNLIYNNQKESNKSSVIDIPYVPPLIRLEDLEKNDMLLPDAEILRLKKMSLQDGFHRKRDINCKYDILAKDGDIFAAYWGKKHGIKIPNGAFSSVKYAQNLTTGEWIVRKMTYLYPSQSTSTIINEADTLDKINLSVIGKKTSQGIRFFRNATSKNTSVAEIFMKNIPGFAWFSLGGKTDYFTHFVRFQFAITMTNELIALHQKNISQYDLHGGNIIYNPAKHTFTIIDFGLADTLSWSNSRDDRNHLISHICSLFTGDSYLISKVIREKYDSLDTINGVNAQENSLAILNELRDFLLIEKNKTPTSKRILKVGVLDIKSNISSKIFELKTYPIIILKDNGNALSPTQTSFLKIKHALENDNVLVLDKAISNASSNLDQFYHHLHELIQTYNPECHAQFYDCGTGKLLTECEPAVTENVANAIQMKQH